MTINLPMETLYRKTTHNTGLAKMAVQCSADNFFVNQSLVLRINIYCENRHLLQAENRYAQSDYCLEGEVKP